MFGWTKEKIITFNNVTRIVEYNCFFIWTGCKITLPEANAEMKD